MMGTLEINFKKNLKTNYQDIIIIWNEMIIFQISVVHRKI